MTIDPVTTECRWRDLPSTVPEGIATAAMNDGLPHTGSPAPWLIEGSGFFWFARADRADRDLLPPELARHARPLRKIGFGVRYSHTPVGTYNELGGIVIYGRPDGVYAHIPFLPVDSAATMRGGRENWSLPKVMAGFTGDPHAGNTFGVTGADWSVSATVGKAGTQRTVTVPRFLGSTLLARVPRPTVSGIEQVDATGARSVTAQHLAGATLAVASTRITVATRGSAALQRLFPDGVYRGGTIDFRGVSLGAPRPRS